MAEKVPSTEETPETGGKPTPPKRGLGHRGADPRDTAAELAARAHAISLEAGSKMAGAMRDVIHAAAGISGFVVESARDLLQFMVRRGQMSAEEADKLIREAEESHARRIADGWEPAGLPPMPEQPAAPATITPLPVPAEAAAPAPAPVAEAPTPTVAKSAEPAPAKTAKAPTKTVPATKTAKAAPAPAKPAKPAAKQPAPAKVPAKAALAKAPAKAPAKPAAKAPAKSGAAVKAPAKAAAKSSKPAAKAPAKKGASAKKR